MVESVGWRMVGKLYGVVYVSLCLYVLFPFLHVAHSRCGMGPIDLPIGTHVVAVFRFDADAGGLAVWPLLLLCLDSFSELVVSSFTHSLIHAIVPHALLRAGAFKAGTVDSVDVVVKIRSWNSLSARMAAGGSVNKLANHCCW